VFAATLRAPVEAEANERSENQNDVGVLRQCEWPVKYASHHQSAGCVDEDVLGKNRLHDEREFTSNETQEWNGLAKP
jgi:hypothetical protein